MEEEIVEDLETTTMTEEVHMMKDPEDLEIAITVKKKVILPKIALILDKKEEILDHLEIVIQFKFIFIDEDRPRNDGKCFNCNKDGHKKFECPELR